MIEVERNAMHLANHPPHDSPVRAMLISLGGAAEPIIHSLATHKPEFVSFLASQKSVFLLGEIREKLQCQEVSFPESHLVLVDDADDLVHCYQKALECTRALASRRLNPDEVIVDYTGGTKSMTAALTLAATGKGYRFCYVGGSRRTKNGVGIVESGFEVVHTGISPWQLFAIEEWRHLGIYIGQYQYEAALTLVADTAPRVPSPESVRWQSLEPALRALLQWDRFNHGEALPLLTEGLKKLSGYLSLRSDRPLETFRAEAQAALTFLKSLAQETHGFKKPSRLLIADLVANAVRRAEQGRYDDAVARFYRALEMQGQIALHERLGAPASDVPADMIPPELREEFIQRYREPKEGKIQLPLMAVFRVLEALDHPTGQQFRERHQDFLKVLSARNQSILAHGFQPVTQEGFNSLKKLLRSAFGLTETVAFPKLDVPY